MWRLHSMQGLGDWPARVAFDEGGDDVTLELLGVVEDVVIDAEHLGDATRVVDVGHRATARVRDAAPELQGRARRRRDPARSSRPAATDESTPPLIATRTFIVPVCQSDRDVTPRRRRR